MGSQKYYFLRTIKVEGRPRLRALPGQVEAVTGTPISTSMNVQADSITRGSYPVGTIFGTTALEFRSHSVTPFYSAGAIFPLGIHESSYVALSHIPSGDMQVAFKAYADQFLNPASAPDPDLEEAKESVANGVKPKPSNLRSLIASDPGMAVPTIEKDGFYVDKKIWQLLVRNIKKKVNTMMIGQTGTGKTELCLLACSKLGIPCTVYDMGSMHDPLSQMLGTHRLKNGQSVFEYARFVEDVQKPGVILLDELPRAPLGTSNILFSCLDSQKKLHVEMAGGEGLREIDVNPDCIFIATANVGAEYTGTFSMDRALISRFFPLEFQYMPEDQETKVLSARFGIKEADARNIVSVASTARSLFKKGELSCNISTRETLAAASLVADGWTCLEAMDIVYLPLFEGDTLEGERSVVSKIFLTR